MTERWWAPKEPGIGPDEFDLSLLAPGNEPDKDLGQQLLAIHRVGAAACEAVATQPLSDEVTLRGVLAAARELVAPPAVEAIAKAFDTPTYGMLLLKDLLDDAEQAAVSIYRTCITKQMAPSIAAHRVGLVYGVPLRELGRYTMLATDPKANKDAVQELADRTLFGFVSKVLAEEQPTGAKELVSKAPAAEQNRPKVREAWMEQLGAVTPDDPATPYHDARERGRFAREGESKIIHDYFPVGRTKLARPKLSRASLGRKKLAPQKAADLQKPQERTQQERVMQVRGKQSREKIKLTPQQRRLQHLLEPLVVPKVASGVGRDDDGKDYLATVPDANDPSEYNPLWRKLSYVFAADEWQARKSGMHVDSDSGEILFRAHALDDGGPFYGEDEHGEASVDHLNARNQIASNLDHHADHKDQPPPVTHVIEGAALTVHDKVTLTRLKQDFLDELEEQLGRRLNKATEIGFVHAAVDALNKDNLVLAWQPPTPGRSALDRPLKAVVEVFVDDESAQGIEYTSKYGHDLQHNPNQALAIVEGQLLWHEEDRGNGYLVRQYTAIAADEEDVDRAHKERSRRRRGFGKRLVVSKAVGEQDAVRLQQLQRLFDQAERDYHGREPGERNAETGEFQRVGTSLGRAKLKRAGVQRAKLQRTAAPVQARVQQERVQQQRQEQVLTQQDREQVALAAKHGASEQTVFLDDGFQYHVLDKKQLGFLLDDCDIPYLEKAYEDTFKLGFASTAMVMDKWKSKGADDTRQDLLIDGEMRWRETPFPNNGGIWKRLGDPYHVDSDKDLAAVALDLEDRLGRDPKIQMLRMVLHERGTGYSITVHGNSVDIGDSHMVRMEDLSGPIQLRPEGHRRLMNRQGIENWLKLRFHGGRNISMTGRSMDYLPIPVVHTWVAERTDDAP